MHHLQFTVACVACPKLMHHDLRELSDASSGSVREWRSSRGTLMQWFAGQLADVSSGSVRKCRK